MNYAHSWFMQNKPVIIVKILTTAKQLVSRCLSRLDSCLTRWPILPPCYFLLFHLPAYVHLLGFFVSGTYYYELLQYLAEDGHVPQLGLQMGEKYTLKLLVDFGFKAIKDAC